MDKQITEEMVMRFNEKLGDSPIRCVFHDLLSADKDEPSGVVEICIPNDFFIKNVRFDIRMEFYKRINSYFKDWGIYNLTYSEDGFKFWSGKFKVEESNPNFGVCVVKLPKYCRMDDIKFYASDLDDEIARFVDDISDRHQRALKSLLVGTEIFESMYKSDRIFQNHYIYLNKETSGDRYRTYQPYIQHIPISIDRNFDNHTYECTVKMRW